MKEKRKKEKDLSELKIIVRNQISFHSYKVSISGQIFKKFLETIRAWKLAKPDVNSTTFVVRHSIDYGEYKLLVKQINNYLRKCSYNPHL